ncbi:MAG TPA: branched-chain amino acid ABC transporter permease [Spirochaetota bacterium]|nr:branched-chain amino acid ABC transporter permease [Spirochaetota bacterium]
MFTPEYLIQQTFNGIVFGAMYALLALGMTVIYGILRLIHFAHGALITVGAFGFYLFFAVLGLPFPAAIVLIIGLGALMGVILDVVAYKKAVGGPEVSMLITSLGFYILIENLMKLIVSPQPYAFPTPELLDRIYSMPALTFRTIDIFIIATSIAIMVFFTLFVKRTKMGVAMRATAESGEAARMVGINIGRVISISFIIASAIAGITGFMWGAKYGQISYNMGFMAGVKAFVAIVIGGVGSIPGAMLGGFILGILEMFSVAFLPPGYAAYRDGIVFFILILILIVKPSGILGQKEVE